MVNATINGKAVCVEKGTTILQAATMAGIKIPTLCYLKEINEIGACRVCMVEIEGKDHLVAACNNVVEEGMVIYTNNTKIYAARRMNVEFILSQHDYQCATCVRNQNCTLQALASELNIIELPFPQEIEKQPWNHSFPIIRDSGKCIKCMRCIQVCEKIQNMNIWDINNTGKRTTVGTKGNIPIEHTDCAVCGQCIIHCPTGALRERNDTVEVMRAIRDPEKVVIVQIAPAVRAAWGESFGLSREEATVGKLVAATRQIGFDYVFDTDFSADLTIMEEGNELFERLGKKNDGAKFPMFTSCCPGWVRFMKTQYPEFTDHLSTAKSPQQMFGAIAKTYYANVLDIDPEKIFCVSVMPCTAKKYECNVPQVNDSGAGKDVDVALTTRELIRLMKSAQVNVDCLEEEEFDQPIGLGTGAGVIFGATGGVMEAALRSAVYFATGENPQPDAFQIVRGQDGIREASVDINGTTVKAAIASGLGNARRLMEQVKNGEVDYDFIEIMACPGGCAGGGGQPIHDGVELACDRGQRLYDIDKKSELRFSHENPAIKDVYEKFLEKPLSHTSHELLHTRQADWDL